MFKNLLLLICWLGVFLGFSASTLGLSFWMGVKTIGSDVTLDIFWKE